MTARSVWNFSTPLPRDMCLSRGHLFDRYLNSVRTSEAACNLHTTFTPAPFFPSPRIVSVSLGVRHGTEIAQHAAGGTSWCHIFRILCRGKPDRYVSHCARLVAAHFCAAAPCSSKCTKRGLCDIHFIQEASNAAFPPCTPVAANIQSGQQRRPLCGVGFLRLLPVCSAEAVARGKAAASAVPSCCFALYCDYTIHFWVYETYERRVTSTGKRSDNR